MTRRYVLSEFVSVWWRDGRMQLTSPMTATTLAAGEDALRLLSAFARPRTIEEVEDEDAAEMIRDWIAAAILVDAGSPEPASVHHWDRASLALHASSRDPAFRKTPGHATPAVAPRRSETAIPLVQGGDAARRPGSSDLAALLEARRSRRTWAKKPIAFETFSRLFWLSARNRGETGFGLVSRPYPSGGAAYTLELYPVVGDDAVDTLAAGVYRYLPEAHALELVSAFPLDCDPFLDVAGACAATTPPPVAIVVTSRYARQSEEYGRIAYTLVLKEVGCLFQTLYLAAESLGLAACALGTGMPQGLLAELCGTSALEEPVVGELALGARAE